MNRTQETDRAVREALEDIDKLRFAGVADLNLEGDEAAEAAVEGFLAAFYELQAYVEDLASIYGVAVPWAEVEETP